MKLLRAIHHQGLVAPVFALAVASVILMAMVAYRILAGCAVWHAYLVWNLFLAWLPLVFAVLAAERFCSGTGVPPVRCDTGLPESSDTRNGLVLSPGRRDACPTMSMLRDRKFMALGIVWLLFFPNAPYIFTDVVHLFSGWRSSFWVELIMILLCALTGFLAGFLSLQVMHGLVARTHGRFAGWLFVGSVSGLAGFGVYLGRFVRLNSWDVLTNPLRLLEGAGVGAWLLVTQWHHTKFLIVFSLFLLLGYGMLFALTQRHGESTTFPDRGVE